MSEANTIPKELIAKHKEGVENLKFYGVPILELERDELLAFANVCAQELTDMRRRFLGFIETARVVNEDMKTTLSRRI